jgi:hypothetical protein
MTFFSQIRYLNLSLRRMTLSIHELKMELRLRCSAQKNRAGCHLADKERLYPFTG